MRFIFSGGGTGGHIYPALTLIEALKKRYPDAEILYVGTKAGLEADIVPKAGINFATLDVSGFKRKLTLKNIKVLCKAGHSLWRARKYIKNFAPDAVIGTGGYVSGPILLAAALRHIPTLIQDQNAIAGITNKILGHFVDKVACGYESSCRQFPPDKAIFTGNPVRAGIFSTNRMAALQKLGWSTQKKTILVTGGSRGAHSINMAMLEVYRHYWHRQDVQILHITGQKEYENIKKSLEKNGLDLQDAPHLLMKPYIYDMPAYLAGADLIISRAGAIGLAEITACGKPSILIPYPYAAENHQEHNARELVNAGAAEMILNRDLTGQKLIAMIEKIMTTDGFYDKMALASKQLGKPDATKDIIDSLMKLVKAKGKDN